MLGKENNFQSRADVGSPEGVTLKNLLKIILVEKIEEKRGAGCRQDSFRNIRN